MVALNYLLGFVALIPTYGAMNIKREFRKTEMVKKITLNLGLVFVLLLYSAIVLSGGLEGITKENVNDFDKKGYTPLTRELGKPGPGSPENLKNLQALLALGADPNLRETGLGKYAPLDLALLRNISLDVVKLLVENGAQITDFDGRGYSLLSLASSKNKEVFKYLLEKGASPNVNVSVSTKSQLLIISLILANETDLVKILLEQGGDPNRLSEEGISPLMSAVTQRNKRMITDLIEYGAGLEGFFMLGKVSGRRPNKQIAQLLLKRGININEQNKKGDTALHMAHYFGNKDLIEFYIKQGADVSIRNHLGQTYLEKIKGN